MDLWWTCPDCKHKVDFVKEMSQIFDENGEAYFDPMMGIGFHLVICENCGNAWSVMMSGKEEFELIKF